jgi:hypothetical protein
MTTKEIMRMFAALEENQIRLTEALEAIQNSQWELANIAQRLITIKTTSTGQVIARTTSTKKIGNKPTKFTGKWDKYQTFVAGFENYLDMNLNVYNTDAIKAWLLFGLLDRLAKAWATKFVLEFRAKDFKFENFFTRFKALYGAQDFGRQAFRQLQSLYQGSSLVADYITWFQTLASQTELSDFDQRNRFFDNLNQKVKSIIASYPKERKESLEALIDAASEAKDSLRSIGGWKDGWKKQQYQSNQGRWSNNSGVVCDKLFASQRYGEAHKIPFSIS